MLVLMNKMLEDSGRGNLFEIWPNLEVYFHGGVILNLTENSTKKNTPQRDFKYYEIYNASEGFFAIRTSIAPMICC
jgi:hypothetical protein